MYVMETLENRGAAAATRYYDVSRWCIGCITHHKTQPLSQPHGVSHSDGAALVQPHGPDEELLRLGGPATATTTAAAATAATAGGRERLGRDAEREVAQHVAPGSGSHAHGAAQHVDMRVPGAQGRQDDVAQQAERGGDDVGHKQGLCSVSGRCHPKLDWKRDEQESVPSK